MIFPVKPKKIKYVYLDHAATTPIDRGVFSAMKPYFFEKYANASTLYKSGVINRDAVEKSRSVVARILGTQSDSIIFTSGGTESCNLAIHPSALYKSGHIITTKVEHKAVLEPIGRLEKEGWKVTYLDVDEFGRIDLNDFKKAMCKDTKLVSIMYVNNEIGTVNPIGDIGREILKYRKFNKIDYPYFHVDACQASIYFDLNVEKLHVDMLSINGSKMYGPKGIGVLYKRRGINIKPIIIGGGQEMGFRGGTENVAGIVGFATAIEIINDKSQMSEEIGNLRNYFWSEIQNKIEGVSLNGPEIDLGDRSPNNLNVSFQGVEGEALVIYMDEYGVMFGTGSACTNESVDVSHVLAACGKSDEEIESSVRFTLGKGVTKGDIDYVMKYLPGVVEGLRCGNFKYV